MAVKVAFVLGLAVAVLVGFAKSSLFTTDDFINNVYLDEDEIVELLWTKLNDTHIEFGVICDNPGWCAIGVSPNGQMPRSDIAFFWIDDNDNNNVYLQDRYAKSRNVPTLDDNQDLTLLAGSQENDVTYIHFIRKIEPCDHNGDDRDISIGTTKMIYAYSENDPTIVYFTNETQVEWHGSNQMGSKSVNLLSYTNTNVNIDYNNSKYFDLRMPSNTVPNDSDTTYYCGLIELPVYNETQHIISIESLVDEGNEAVVHHMVVYHCPSSSVNKSNIGFSMNCDDYAEMEIPSSGCTDGGPVYAWAIGGETFNPPNHVGIAMSGNDTNDNTLQYVILEIHYDNPKYESGIVDSSGFRIWYTDELRNETASGFWVGLNVNAYTHFIPAGIEFTNTAYCDPACLGLAIPETGVKIFSAFLHAHTHGVALKSSIIRNGTEIEIIDNNPNYDFDYQTTTYLENEITLLPGDTIYMECTYNTENDESTVYSGFATSNEMCLVWLYVYPYIDLRQCLNMWDWDNGYYDWYIGAYARGYLDSSYLWTGTSEGAVSYYENLWLEEGTNDISRYQICTQALGSNWSFVDDKSDYGIWSYDPQMIDDYYEYETYCNWTDYTSTNYVPTTTDETNETDDCVALMTLNCHIFHFILVATFFIMIR